VTNDVSLTLLLHGRSELIAGYSGLASKISTHPFRPPSVTGLGMNRAHLR
jgi:hypothetical protein